MVVATDLRDPTRDVVVESKDKVACGACGRRLRRPRCCGKRSFCTASVDAEGIARVFHSTGRVHRPARARRERRGCRERDRARCDVVAGRVLMSSPFAYQPQTTKGRNGNDKQERTKEGTRKEGRKEEGRRTEQTITSPTKDFSLQVAGAANRSRTMPTSWDPAGSSASEHRHRCRDSGERRETTTRRGHTRRGRRSTLVEANRGRALDRGRAFTSSRNRRRRNMQTTMDSVTALQAAILARLIHGEAARAMIEQAERVAQAVETDRQQAILWLHQTLNHETVTCMILMALGFDRLVVDAADTLSIRYRESVRDYGSAGAEAVRRHRRVACRDPRRFDQNQKKSPGSSTRTAPLAAWKKATARVLKRRVHRRHWRTSRPRIHAAGWRPVADNWARRRRPCAAALIEVDRPHETARRKR